LAAAATVRGDTWRAFFLRELQPRLLAEFVLVETEKQLSRTAAQANLSTPLLIVADFVEAGCRISLFVKIIPTRSMPC
jgi:hypothetical protein